MTLIVYGLSRAATHAWSDTLTVVTLGIGAALVVMFPAHRAPEQAASRAA
jgi:hypothetical protein